MRYCRAETLNIFRGKCTCCFLGLPLLVWYEVIFFYVLIDIMCSLWNSCMLLMYLGLFCLATVQCMFVNNKVMGIDIFIPPFHTTISPILSTRLNLKLSLQLYICAVSPLTYRKGQNKMYFVLFCMFKWRLDMFWCGECLIFWWSLLLQKKKSVFGLCWLHVNK